MCTDAQKTRIIELAEIERAEYIRVSILWGKPEDEVQKEYLSHKEFYDEWFLAVAKIKYSEEILQ